MMQRVFMTILAVLCLAIMTVWNPMYGQEAPVDPSGYIVKYNKGFQGIGPKVYILPAPRTKMEMLTDVYKEIVPFRDSIQIALKHQKFMANFKAVSNEEDIQRLLDPVPATDAVWDSLIHEHVHHNLLYLGYGLLNEYAKYLTALGEVDKAIARLEQALEYASAVNNPPDVAIIQANLSTLQFLNMNAQEAEKHEEAYYAQASKSKNAIDQGLSLVRLAHIQALDKNYRSAENTIIRKAIPLFNRSRHYEGKIWAWEMLADIYQAQNKHTEAQWFLIQARDLARLHEQESELAEIEYMLGYSKFIQKNYEVAKGEFINAYDLAEKEENALLKLAIVEKLGNIYLSQRNVELADTLLKEYWQLRTALF